MGQRYTELPNRLLQFIDKQKMFFVATATADSSVNLSPKGNDSLRVLNPTKVIWLNLTGSGNETSAHVQECPRMTIMFNAFEGPPMILRIFGQAKVIHPRDKEWNELYSHFEPILGARQIFDLSVELVQSSCGFGVPFYDFKNERSLMEDWAEKKGEQGIVDYWDEKNRMSLDGKDIDI